MRQPLALYFRARTSLGAVHGELQREVREDVADFADVLPREPARSFGQRIARFRL